MPLLGETYITQMQNVRYRIAVQYKTKVFEGNDLEDFHNYIKELPTIYRLVFIPYQTQNMAAPSLLLEWQEDGIPLRDLNWSVFKVEDSGQKIEPLGFYFQKFPRDKGRITF